MHAINDAYERMLRSDVRYRFVLDLATIDVATGERAT
jgi:D-arabinose 1-dehydrogenase-like Zn-dependent alcohol dehydrogenase